MVSFAPVTFVNLDALAAAAVPFAETQFAQDALPASSIPSADAPFWNLVEAAISDAPEPCGRSLEEEEKDSRAEQRPPSGDTVMPPAWLHLFALPASEPVLPYSLAAIGAPTEDTAEEPEGDGIVQPVPASRDGHFRIDVPVSREPLVRWRADVAYAELIIAIVARDDMREEATVRRDFGETDALPLRIVGSGERRLLLCSERCGDGEPECAQQTA